eukprot:12937537-Prorocentrum_lima.AAC.1
MMLVCTLSVIQWPWLVVFVATDGMVLAEGCRNKCKEQKTPEPDCLPSSQSPNTFSYSFVTLRELCRYHPEMRR